MSHSFSIIANPSASSDVKSYRWQPDRFLSCNSCKSPVVTPTENITYTLTVTNDKGCIATDTVSVGVLCTESTIYIPNAFTPNGDGKNDVFMITGQGIKLVKFLKIFDRFGNMIFEKRNFSVNDRTAAWDGRVKGILVNAGSFVYMAELSCDEKSFLRKGTITVLY